MKHLIIFLVFYSSTVLYAQDIIPFELKEDNRMYLKAVINQSDTLNLVFDLGANITVVNKTRMKKNSIHISFDSVVHNRGANGSSEQEIGFSNTVSLGQQKYTDIDIIGISYPEEDILDGIIGWNFFKDKTVQINYESKKLLIYDKPIERPKGCVKI